MPAKKRKYEARFPTARIKKIMQTDEEIGKVATAVPVIISRSLEIFLQSLVETTARYTNERKAKTMTTSHLKHCIENERKFDFLKDLVANIAEMANQEEEDSNEAGEKPKKQRKPRVAAGERKKRKKSSDDDESVRSSDMDEKVVNPSLSISSMASSVPSASQQSSYSIDSIMGNPQDSCSQSMQQNHSSQFSTPQENTQQHQNASYVSDPHDIDLSQQQQQQQQPQSSYPIISNQFPSFNSMQGISTSSSSIPVAPINMNLPTSLQQTANDDEDDDYDI